MLLDRHPAHLHRLVRDSCGGSAIEPEAWTPASSAPMEAPRGGDEHRVGHRRDSRNDWWGFWRSPGHLSEAVETDWRQASISIAISPRSRR